MILNTIPNEPDAKKELIDEEGLSETESSENLLRVGIKIDKSMEKME